jgi:hypothetical protein
MAAASAASAEDRLPIAALLLIWAATAAALAVIHWHSLDDAFGSPDNAMRLTEVRAFLAGASWFDLHETRLNPPFGYDTHWSRLLDAGIAGLILLFRQFANPDLAERLARCIWPLLWSGPAVLACYASALRLGGAGAARATLIGALLALLMIPGIFVPGEIDHHNAQVTLTLVMVACVLWCDEKPRLATNSASIRPPRSSRARSASRWWQASAARGPARDASLRPRRRVPWRSRSSPRSSRAV